MKTWLMAVAVTVAGQMAAAQAVDVRVDISEQRMSVKRHGKVVAVWPVSTARKGKVTPTGTWSPKVLKRKHFSSLYNNAPMPWSIFYSGNFAIHGTNATSKLGRPASAGGVRLHPENARQLYNWVQNAGMKNTRIRVVR